MREWACVVFVVSLGAACDGAGNASSDRDERMPSGTGGVPDGADASAALVDPNGTFETSRPLPFGEEGALMESISGNDDLDYFVFEGRAGQWVSIVSEILSVVEVASTPLTLLDSSRSQVAQNDYVSSIQGENVLSRLVVRLPSDGTYYVLVHDPRAPPAGLGLMQPYRLILNDLTGASVRYAVADDVTAEAKPVAFKTWALEGDSVDDAFLLGDFSSSSDVDAFSFEVVSDVVRLATFQLEPAGIEGNGSTISAGAVWVTDVSGSEVIGRIDAASGQEILGPPLAPGSYLLWVSHPGGVTGSNDFFVVRAMLRSENQREGLEMTNGDLAGAESITVQQTGDEAAAYLVAHLPDADVDYYRLDFPAGTLASAYCGSFREGSGVVGLHVELRDAADVMLAEAMETTSELVSILDVPIPPGGVYLRATKESQLEGVTGDWMRCGIYAY